ncbi:MAG: hydrogenase formation protein HypD [Deltaproteobacteria bacterium]|nr:hydrogenase formation protein HypD [Deltaproteobacteria bacterium]
MRLVDEYRDPALAHALATAVVRRATRRWTVMEVCGGQTHAIVEHGLDQLVAPAVELLHGPGCPVCVTPLETLDRAASIAEEAGAIVCSFGDMLRVPGSRGDLFAARARGGDVRVVATPLDAARLAERIAPQPVVFLAVGFETTAPAAAAAARWALARGLANFFLLVAHVRVPPALEAIAAAPDARVHAFLAAGHVCTVMGTAEYESIAARHRVPIVATGFEPVDILEGLALAVAQLEDGAARVENQYRRAVRPEGNPAARALVDEVFAVADRPWRGIGLVPRGGLVLRDRYRALDAEQAFPACAAREPAREPEACRAADVLRGALRPPACPAFGRGCTPEHPLGAPMVSPEGACAAYFRWRGAEEAP